MILRPRKTLKIKLDIPDELKSAVVSILDFIAITAEIQFVLVNKKPDIIYSYYADSSAAWHLKFNPEYYQQNKIFKCINPEVGKFEWTFDGNHEIDYIGTIYRFLYLKDEKINSKKLKSNFTSFYTTSLNIEKQEVISTPIVDYTISMILELLNIDWKRKPNKINVILTHDVDGPEISNIRLIIKSLVKLIVRRENKFFWQFIQGVKHLIYRDSGPYWRFSEWAKKEAELGAKSVFFVFPGRKGYKNHLNDPAYSVDSRKKWKILNELEDIYQCEIGYQPGINAKFSEVDFKKDLKHLRDLKLKIYGTRHHYWELDWNKPWETLTKHVNNELKYDMSMAWKDKIGFRIGTSFPLQSINVKKKHITIPTTIIDSHLFDYQNFNKNKVMSDVISVVEHIARFNGYLVLDWHERTFEDSPIYKNQSKLYFEIINYLKSKYEVEFHLPRDLAHSTMIKYEIFKTYELAE